MELIDRQALLWEFKTNPKYHAHVASLAQCIHDVPTVDAVPVVHGHWIELGEADYQCSMCGFRFTSSDPIDMFKYCRCGARMYGVASAIKSEELCRSCTYDFDTHCRHIDCSLCPLNSEVPYSACRCLEIHIGEECPHYIKRRNDDGKVD